MEERIGQRWAEFGRERPFPPFERVPRKAKLLSIQIETLGIPETRFISILVSSMVGGDREPVRPPLTSLHVTDFDEIISQSRHADSRHDIYSPVPFLVSSKDSFIDFDQRRTTTLIVVEKQDYLLTHSLTQ